MMMPSRTVSFSFAILATMLLSAHSQTFDVAIADVDIASDTNVNATEAPLLNQIAVPTQGFRCLGICGEEEELEDPDEVITYQWNLRVPVCSGISCETESCSYMDEKLGELQMSEVDCSTHRQKLRAAGCLCMATLEDLLYNDNDDDDDNSTMGGVGNDTSNTEAKTGDAGYQFKPNWWILGIVSGVFVLIWFCLWLGVLYDRANGKIAAKKKKKSAKKKEIAETQKSDERKESAGP